MGHSLAPESVDSMSLLVLYPVHVFAPFFLPERDMPVALVTECPQSGSWGDAWYVGEGLPL